MFSEIAIYCEMASLPPPGYIPSLGRQLDDFREQNKRLILRDVMGPDGKEPSISGAGQFIDLVHEGTTLKGRLLHQIFDSSKLRLKKIAFEKIHQEIQFMNEMCHPNVVKFVGLYYQDTSIVPIMVMENWEWSLTDFLFETKQGVISRQKTLQILLDICEGLIYLHDHKRLAHLKLYSTNIRLTFKLHAKVAGFGPTRVLEILSTEPGIEDFMAPEILEILPQHSTAADIFSFGCIIVHTLTHQWPKPGLKAKRNIMLSEYERRAKHLENYFGNPLLPLIRECLSDHNFHRPTASTVKSHIKLIFTDDKM